MDNILFSGVVSFIITFFAIPVIIQVARERKMFDEPDERKVHKMVIPTLGGLGIFAGFILATLLCVPVGSNELQYFAAAAIVIFFWELKMIFLFYLPQKSLSGSYWPQVLLLNSVEFKLPTCMGF